MVGKYKLYSRTFFVLFWVLMCNGFIFQMVPLPAVVKTFVLLASDTVLFLLAIFTLRNRGDVVFILSFLALAFTSTILINHLRLIDFFNGTRDFFGLLFSVPIVRWLMQDKYRANFCKSFDKQLNYWLYLQAFCATIQFYMFDDFDEVGGSMGDGSSGFLSMYLYLISFYFVRKNWDCEHYFKSLKQNIRYIILLYPSFLNETKISFFLLLMYFILLMKFDRTLLFRMLYILPMSLAGLVVLFNIYCGITNQDPDEVFSVKFIEMYMMSGEIDLEYDIDAAQRLQDGEWLDEFDSTYSWGVDIPRFAKFIVVSPVMADYPGGFLWGLGVGHFKGTQMLEPTSFAKEYNWAVQGSRIWVFTVFMQLGILGLIWMALFIVRLLRGRTYGHLARRVLFYIIGCIFIIFVYNETFRMPVLCLVMFYILFEIHLPQPENLNNKLSVAIKD